MSQMFPHNRILHYVPIYYIMDKLLEVVEE